jgi:hypothetical protein
MLNFLCYEYKLHGNECVTQAEGLESVVCSFFQLEGLLNGVMVKQISSMHKECGDY